MGNSGEGHSLCHRAQESSTSLSLRTRSSATRHGLKMPNAVTGTLPPRGSGPHSSGEYSHLFKSPVLSFPGPLTEHFAANSLLGQLAHWP